MSDSDAKCVPRGIQYFYIGTYQIISLDYAI